MLQVLARWVGLSCAACYLLPPACFLLPVALPACNCSSRCFRGALLNARPQLIALLLLCTMLFGPAERQPCPPLLCAPAASCAAPRSVPLLCTPRRARRCATPRSMPPLLAPQRTALRYAVQPSCELHCVAASVTRCMLRCATLCAPAAAPLPASSHAPAAGAAGGAGAAAAPSAAATRHSCVEPSAVRACAFTCGCATAGVKPGWPLHRRHASLQMARGRAAAARLGPRRVRPAAPAPT